MNNPKSIFTGHRDRASNSTPNPESRRLSTPEYRETLSSGSAAPKPSFAPDDDAFFRPSWTSASASGRPAPNGQPLSSEQLKNCSVAGNQEPSATHSKKRPVHPSSLFSPPTIESFHKRRRLQTRARHSLNSSFFQGPPVGPNQPPSPLFFSNSTQKRPQLPPRFSSSEAAARMLSKARGEESAVKTVTLARGTITGSSPPGVTSAPSARSSADRSSLPRIDSPDGKEKNDSLKILGQVGIVELLEQDGRPTFTVDLQDPVNYGAGSIQMLFQNTALRSNPALAELVTGRSSDESPVMAPSKSYPNFKAWVFSALMGGESLDVCLPPLMHGGLSWSCSTVRKRFRVVSGSFVSTFSSSQTSQPDSTGVPVSAPSTAGLSFREPSNPAPIPESHNENEPPDYFGTAAPPPPPPAQAPPDLVTDPVVETVEQVETSKITTIGFNGKMVGRPSDIASLDMNPSLVNECVLRAATVGEVDAFSSAPSAEVGFFDWTRLPLNNNLPRHIQFARSIDWAATGLGPIEFWSADLRQMCNLIMASPHPAAMYWGDDLVAIYNEAYVLLAGQKHPKLMGQSYKEAWAEIWDEVKGVFAEARASGQATMKDDDCLFIKRSNYLEETYFSWSIIPMVGGDGTVMGLYNPAFEKTRRKIAERRMLTLREVGELTASARDVKAFWEQVLQALDSNPLDTPFVTLYSVSDDSDSDSSSINSSSLLGTKQCYLEGALGVPSDHPAAPGQIDLKTGMEGFGPVFREVMKTDKPVVLEIGSGDLPAEMMDGMQWRGFGDPCTSVVVCPIHPTTGESILGFLVIGVNPRRPYDDDYGLFIQLLSRQLATSLASVVLFEEEIRRGQRAAKLAALDRMELSEQLAARTQEAIDSETRFTRMAEFSPAGLFIANSEGHITYCNDTWYEISRVPKDTRSTDRWIEAVKEEDQALIRRLWSDLVENTEPMTAEFRFKAPWQDRNGNHSDTWVLFSAYPEKNDQGNLKSVFGSITNISQQKWAEGFQKRKMEEAVEMKRQQENFIDITSHEMRNPLSAILQCADEIATSLDDFQSECSHEISDELVSSNIDAAQTIALCAQHQKRIVDDVLTLSKLDSAMLMVTPVDVQPLNVVQRALKMFEGELATSDIQMNFVVDDSFKQLGIDWVKLDPSRVLQVLINLTTNAIKFTTTEHTRTITVKIAASMEKPSSKPNRPVNYFPSRSKRMDMTEGPDWGDGDQVYVHFSVQDTGRGLNDEEKKLLFLRFSQASPRTHVQYGGSGLGLFISRELTELQGGEIGVASEAGKGSTFAFYVKARRSQPPKDPVAEVLPLALARQPSGSRGRNRKKPAVKTKDFATLAAANAKKSASPTTNPAEVMPLEPLHVLVVEDNLINQKVMSQQLRRQGCIVHVANHGLEALSFLETSTFAAQSANNGTSTTIVGNPDTSGTSTPTPLSVILMDLEMPIMDGLTCVGRIREMQREGQLLGYVPVVAVTANARSEQIAKAIERGMDIVVTKPFRIPELIPQMRSLVERVADQRKAN